MRKPNRPSACRSRKPDWIIEGTTRAAVCFHCLVIRRVNSRGLVVRHEFQGQDCDGSGTDNWTLQPATFHTRGGRRVYKMDPVVV